MQFFEENLTGRIGGALQPLSGVRVTVANTVGTAVTVYGDDAGLTVLPQPLITDSTGYFSFHAPDGSYVLTFSGSQFTTFTRHIHMLDSATVQSVAAQSIATMGVLANQASASAGNAAASASAAGASASAASASQSAANGSAGAAASAATNAQDWATKTDGKVGGIDYSAKYYAAIAAQYAGSGGGSVTWASITGKPTTIIGYGITDAALASHTHAGVYQPVDADLTAIAGLSGTTGLLKKTAADTWVLDTATYLTASDIVDSLTSTATNKALSAAQGKALYDQQGNIAAALAAIIG